MLKNILSLLLSKFYSKQESEAVGHQAMPELSQYIDLTSNATTNVENTYVAPTDGYFVCATKGGEWSGVNVWGTLDVGVPGASGIQGKVFTPCVKGASVHYIIYGTIHLVRFYKTIGGGYQTLKKLILQGGGLCCLKHLYSSLLRSFCRVRKNGLLNNGTCRLRMWLLFLFQTTMTFILMFLQRTVCWCLGNLVRQELVTWKSTPLVRDLISISQALEFTKVLQCRLIEAKRFLSRQPQITEEIIRSFTSSRLSVKREVGLGGASC
jgi:hypothetical protein